MFSKIPLLRALKHDRWVRPYLKRYRWTLAIAIFLGVCTFFCAGALMFTAGYLISKSATHPYNILLVYVPIVLTRAFGIGRPAFQYAERLTSHNWVLKMTSHFRKQLYDSLEPDAVFLTGKYQLGDILGLLAEDVSHIQNLYLRTIFPMMVSWGLYLIIIVGIGIISPLMALWLLLLFGLMIFAVPFWSILVNGARQVAEKKQKNELYADFTDNVMGITDWTFAGRGDAYVAAHQKHENQLVATKAAMHRFELLRDFVQQLLLLAIAISLIIWGAENFGGVHGPSANWIAAFVLAIFPLDEAFAALPAAAQETNIYTDSLVRLNRLNQPEKPAVKKLSLHGPYDFEINNLHYTYPQTDHEILKGLNLTIRQGEKIAILGRSGSGKTTLASLLRGDRTPTVGTISLNGVPTSEFGDQMAQYLGVMNQTPYLFNTSLANNIRLGDEEASDEQIWDVLERVKLKKMVERLPKGLNTMVDEAGLRFSGGERHRLALARILLKDTPIVLFDEPTVGLDPLTEQDLLDTIKEQLRGKTLIWITHHLQGIDMMDQVIFLEDGQLTMQGSPSQLEATNQHFRDLKAADQGRLH